MSVAFRWQLPAFEAPVDTEEREGAEPLLPAETAGIDQKEALRLFRQAARLEPTDPDYHYILGLGFARAEHYPEAAGAFAEAVSLNRLDADYRVAHAAALWELGRDELAAQEFREALHLRPGDPLALNGLGCALTRLQREPEALKYFEDALRADQTSAETQGNLAIAMWRQGRSAEALRAFRKAVSLAPTSFVLRTNLGLALAAASAHREAVTAFRHAVTRRPESAEAHYDLAESLHAAHQPEEAQKALERAVELDSALLASRPRSQEIRAAALRGRIKAELALERRPSSFNRLFAAFPSVPTWRVPGHFFFAGAAAVVLYLGFRLGTPIVSRFLLADDIAAIAGAPVGEDGVVADRLRHAIDRRGLSAHVTAADCQIQTRPQWRRITCRYEVPVVLLPRVRWTLRFHIDEEKPYLLQPETLHL